MRSLSQTTMKPSVAIITGASRGIGRATALRLAKDFSGVVLAARNGEALNQVAALVKQTGAEPLPMPLDLREPSAAKTLVDGTLKQFGCGYFLATRKALYNQAILHDVAEKRVGKSRVIVVNAGYPRV